MNDYTFWSIADGPAFRRKWGGRVHPLIRDNGGIDFYNVEGLTQMLTKAQKDWERMPKVGLSATTRLSYPNVLRDWLHQVCWIHEYAAKSQTGNGID